MPTSPFSSDQLVNVVYMVTICLMKVTCFILGYLIVRLGFDLIRDGVKGEFTFKSSLGGFKADLVSVSPGLLFVLLGVILIGYSMWVNKSFSTNERETVTTRPKGSTNSISVPNTYVPPEPHH